MRRHVNCTAAELIARSFSMGSFWDSPSIKWTARSDYWVAKYTFTVAAGKVGYVMATDQGVPSNLVSIWDSTGTIVSGVSVTPPVAVMLP